MHFPELYEVTNFASPRDSKEIIKNYSNLIKWRADQKDSILDIGCGTGSITHDIILPLVPSTFSKIVGADISEEMVEYAKKKYFHPKLEFCLIDIEDKSMDKYFPYNEQFDHIISTFCFQWVSNQKQAMKNIYNLLTPNGDCLIITAVHHDPHDTYKKLAEMKKWSKYMEDYKTYISPFQYVDKLETEQFKILTYAGFKNYTVDVLENRSIILKGLVEAKKHLKSVNAFVHRIPEHLQDEYMNDKIKIKFPDVTDDQAPNWNYEIKYSLIVSYAWK